MADLQASKMALLYPKTQNLDLRGPPNNIRPTYLGPILVQGFPKSCQFHPSFGSTETRPTSLVYCLIEFEFLLAATTRVGLKSLNCDFHDAD